MSGIVGANFTKDSGVVASQKFQRFTADGTWVKPSGITAVRIEAIGAGGGGGRRWSGQGAGGGGGRRGVRNVSHSVMNISINTRSSVQDILGDLRRVQHMDDASFFNGVS